MIVNLDITPAIQNLLCHSRNLMGFSLPLKQHLRTSYLLVVFPRK
uniref:Uncharacterized protein MANES_17G040900 n=1 Tax=Rhizophora mucronata TaxID=61149 RepID=A0A2P2NQP3_RHIMU